MGSRPGTTGRVATLPNGHGNGAQAGKDGRVKKGATTRHPTSNGEPALKLVAVSKSYGRNAVLKAINFAVAPGELVEVTGPSGAGKTTFLRLLHGQLRPTGGEVWVRGQALHRRWRRGLGQLRRDVAFVFQEQRLLPRLNALENIVFALQVRDPQVPDKVIRQRAVEALKSVKLGHRGGSYPHQLSAGERQRVAVARALATKPRVLLADEPLASMDEENAALVMRLIEQTAAGGTTVVVATHHHTFGASRILRLPSAKVMSNGARRPRIAANGNGHQADGAHGNGHAGTDSGVAANKDWWRVIVPARPRPHRAVKSQGLPLWRRAVAFTANGYRLVVLNGLRSWSRDARQTLPVLGTIALLLMLCGTLALVGVAVQGAVADQAGQASIVRVYLSDSATQDSIAALRTKLTADPRVASVTYISQQQALEEARKRPGLDNLSSLDTANPFPASFDVRVQMVTQVAAVAASVKGDPAVDPAYPTSYDPDTYSRLRRIALIAGGIAGGIVLLFAIVSYAVIANAMRGIAAARRGEFGVARLLGARGWMVRGPFVVEGLTTGAIAGALAAAAVAGAYLLATRFEASVYVQVLPGVDLTAVRYVLAAIITAGLLLGTATAMLGFRKAQA